MKFLVFFWTLDLAEFSWELFKEGKSTGWVFLISLWSFLFVNCLKRIKNSKQYLNTPDLVEIGIQIWEHVCHRPLFWSMHLFVPNGTFSAMQFRNQKLTKWMGLLSAWSAWIIYMVSRTFPCHSEVKELKIFNINDNLATKEAKQEIKSELC